MTPSPNPSRVSSSYLAILSSSGTRSLPSISCVSSASGNGLTEIELDSRRLESRILICKDSHTQATSDITPAALPMPIPIFVPKPSCWGSCGASGCGGNGVAAVDSEVDEAATVEEVGIVNVEVDVGREADTVDDGRGSNKEALLTGEKEKVIVTVEVAS